MKRPRLLTAVCITAGTAITVLLAWEISAEAQRTVDKPPTPQTFDLFSESIKVDASSDSSAVPATATAGATPEKAVSAFLEALRSRDKESAAALLSARARKACERANLPVAPPRDQQAKLIIVNVEWISENKDIAHVLSQRASTGFQTPRTDNFTWVVRKESEGWRIAGLRISIPSGSEPLQLDFEDAKDIQQKMVMVQNEMYQNAKSSVATREPTSAVPRSAIPVIGPPSPMSVVVQSEPVLNEAASAPTFSSSSPNAESSSNVSRDSWVTKVVPLKYANASELQPQIQGLFSGNHLVYTASDIRTNQVTVHGAPGGVEKVLEFLKALDVPGVEMKSQIAELRPGERDVFAQTDGVPPQLSANSRYGDAAGPQRYPMPAKPVNSPYDVAEKRASEIAAEYRKLASSEDKTPPGSLSSRPGQLDALWRKLKPAVEAAFNERQKSQTAELDGLRQRLNQIEAAISTREKNREAIINRRVEELINPDVKWDAGAALANPPVADPRSSALVAAPSDQQTILGKWKTVSALDGGKPAGHHFSGCVITKDLLIVSQATGERDEEFTYRLDPTQTPKWIDLQECNSNRAMIRAIYEINGDELQICMPESQGRHNRPTWFQSQPGSRNDILIKLKRDN